MIYLIGNRSEAICKIGYTAASVESRLQMLQTGNPHPLYIFGKRDGGVAEERALHAKYAALRLAGEWFTLTDEIAAEFAFDKNAPSRLWAVSMKFKHVAGDTTTITTALVPVFAPSSPEAITAARIKSQAPGRCLDALAMPIPYEDISRAFELKPWEFSEGAAT